MSSHNSTKVTNMKGWKTYLGGAIIGIAQVLTIMNIITPDIATHLTALGGALLGVGIGHKLDKATDDKKIDVKQLD